MSGRQIRQLHKLAAKGARPAAAPNAGPQWAGPPTGSVANGLGGQQAKQQVDNLTQVSDWGKLFSPPKFTTRLAAPTGVRGRQRLAFRRNHLARLIFAHLAPNAPAYLTIYLMAENHRPSTVFSGDSNVSGESNVTGDSKTGETAAAAPTKREKRWRRTILVAAAALVLGPVLVRGGPVELGKWKLAEALDLELDGRYGEAIEKVDQAIAYRGAPLDWRLRRAQLNLKAQNFEAALDDLNAVLDGASAKLSPDPASTQSILFALNAYGLRSQTLYSLGRHEEAIADAKTLHERFGSLSSELEATTLNGLAYQRALANRELEAALADVNRALELSPMSYSFLDTRAFVLYRLGKYDLAAQDMKPALAGAHKNHDFWNAASARDRYDPRELDEVRRESAKTLAVLYYHYGLILTKQKKINDAAFCGLKVKELGFEYNDKLF
jgi:tetratricopeptide (TPR) repeat protein